jgi:hypothetical protein
MKNRVFNLCAAAFGVLFLSACAAFSGGDAESVALRDACPETGLVYGAGNLALTDKSRVVVDKASMACKARAEGKSADLNIVFAVKGERPASDVAFDYFIAIVDADENILQREAFSGVIPASGGDAGRAEDSISITLPKPAGTRIAIGFIQKAQQGE